MAALALLSGCGARTAPLVEPCGDSGTARPCETVCGEGVQRCDGARWGSCEVPPAELPCANECGAGFAFCSEGVLEDCVVAPTRVPCENVCGEGTAECRDGRRAECEVPIDERPCSTACGDGVEMCVDGRWGPCSADLPLPPSLQVRVRDFSRSHPDFEAEIGVDRGIVEDRLGDDDKPVYRGPSPTTHGRALFDQWYRDVAGVNVGVSIELPLVPRAGDAARFEFSNLEFFPIDGRLLGNEGAEHNFHFTLEASGEFVYNGGERFRFEGDDDVFVFIDRQLVIDLGGVHSREEEIVELDRLRERLGLREGETYPIHLFFAERHTDRSTFTIDTTISRTLRCE